MIAEAAWMPPAQLLESLGRAGAPTVIDVRRREAFESSDCLIPTARWRDHSQTALWADELAPQERILVYCVHGHGLSQGAAALLRSRGLEARALRGGIEGYLAAGGITVARRTARRDAGKDSRWVTAHGSSVERLASAWLIRRFVDPRACLLFVDEEQVDAVAMETGAVAFGVAGTALGPVGDNSGFDALLRHFAIDDPALQRIARQVRGSHGAPQSAGLEALCLGLARIHPHESAALEHAMGLYDALYAWAGGVASTR